MNLVISLKRKPLGDRLNEYKDPNNSGNSAKYRTGKKCIEEGCENLAGTYWGPYWCFQHNVERIDRINASFAKLVDGKLNKEIN